MQSKYHTCIYVGWFYLLFGFKLNEVAQFHFSDCVILNDFYLMGLSLSFHFLHLPEEAFSIQKENLKEEKEYLAKLQKECTAKRWMSTGVLFLLRKR